MDSLLHGRFDPKIVNKVNELTKQAVTDYIQNIAVEGEEGKTIDFSSTGF